MEEPYLANIDVLIAAFEARSPQQVDLTLQPDGFPIEERQSVLGMVALLSHFRAQGVRVVPPRRLALVDGAGDDALSSVDVFERLFGVVEQFDPLQALASRHGAGPWDAWLIAWFPEPPDDRQLVLARLLYARQVIQHQASARTPLPEHAPPTICAALRLPDPRT